MRRHTRAARMVAAVAAIVMVAAACGGGGTDDESTATAGDESSAGDTGDESSATAGGESTAGDTGDESTAAASGDAPTTDDHWHVPYGVFICDDSSGAGFIQPFPSSDDPDGIHSHADGIIHIHPFSADVAGSNATLGRFFSAMGLILDDESISVAGGDAVAEGFECNGEPTVLQVARWQLDDLDADPEVFTDGLADIAFTTDLAVYTIAYLPAGDEVPQPPTIASLATITDVDPAEIPVLPDGLTVARPEPPGPGAAISGATPCPADDAERTTTFEQPPPVCIDEDLSYEAVITTSEGVVRVTLDTENTPNTVNNFVVLAEYGYYDGSALFRTDPSIDIIQGGAPTTNSPSDPGPGYTIADEGDFEVDDATGALIGPYTYQPGDLVMARSQGPDSSGAQFFFAAGPNAAFLDSQGTFLNFGTTVEGLDVLEGILASHVDDPTSQLGGGPGEAVIVESIEIIAQ